MSKERYQIQDWIETIVTIKGRVSVFWIPVVLLVIYLIYIPLTELFVRSHYSGIYVSVIERQELIEAFTAYFVLAPGLWFLYIWQLRIVPNMFSQLVKNGVFKEKKSVIEKLFIEEVSVPFRSKVIWCIAICLSIIGLGVFGLKEFRLYPRKWFIVYTSVFIFAHAPLVALTTTLTIVALYRQIVTVRAISRLFSKVSITVKPLHPDRAGGFGAIGEFARNLLAIGIIAGFLINVFIFAPVLYGEEPDIQFLTLSALMGYIILFPVLLLSPIIPVHRAMVKYKMRLLLAISSKASKVLETLSEEDLDDEIKDVLSCLTELDKTAKAQNVLDKLLPTWPVNIQVIRQIILTFLSPIVPPLLNLILGFVQASYF